MNQFLGMKMKRLFVVLLLAPLFVVPSICSAVNACVDGTPILNVIAPNPKTPGATVSYSVKAIGSGFATYEIRASDVERPLQSGIFISGQTVSGDYKTPSGRGTVTFKIKDSSGNDIRYCSAYAEITFGQDTCEQNFKDERKSYIWGKGILLYPEYWGEPTYYFYCSRYASPSSRNYLANFLNTGLVNSGNVRDDQMVIGFYRIPFGTKKETYSFTTPDSSNPWENDYGFNGHFLSWATGARPCKASFSLRAVGSNIQFDANKSNIYGSRPDNYKWKVGADYLQGSIVSASFSAGKHTILLTVDDSLGTSCSSSRTITIPVPPPPPPPPPCTVDFDVKNSAKSCLTSSCNYNEPITFAVSVSTGTITDYTWKMNKPSGATEAFTDSIITGASVTSVSKTFVPADGKVHEVTLVAHDSNGNTCYADNTLTIKPALPGWTEIAPYLMQLGPLGFLVLVFLARIIFLRL